MGQLVEILAVAVEELAPGGRLLGANLDEPRVGRKVAAGAVEVGGWALGEEEMPEEVEAVVDGAVIARAPVGHPRPDIGSAFPGLSAAASAGFDLILDGRQAPAESEVALRARFGSDVVPIGSIRLRRCWRGQWNRGESPLISVIVVGEQSGDGFARTLATIAEQRYAATELLVGPTAQAGEGIRRSNGELLAFIAAGEAFATAALADGVETLARRPEAAGLVDGDGRAALYRRSLFEELGNFDERLDLPWHRELARRAAAYNALHEPGSLIATEGA
jgi:hypothetical protein